MMLVAVNETDTTGEREKENSREDLQDLGG